MSEPRAMNDLWLSDEAIEALGFEEAQARLEQVVAELENDGCELATALQLYELGLKLRDRCRRWLDEADAMLERLSEDADGNAIIEPAREMEP